MVFTPKRQGSLEHYHCILTCLTLSPDWYLSVKAHHPTHHKNLLSYFHSTFRALLRNVRHLSIVNPSSFTIVLKWQQVMNLLNYVLWLVYSAILLGWPKCVSIPSILFIINRINNFPKKKAEFLFGISPPEIRRRKATTKPVIAISFHVVFS